MFYRMDSCKRDEALVASIEILSTMYEDQVCIWSRAVQVPRSVLPENWTRPFCRDTLSRHHRMSSKCTT